MTKTLVGDDEARSTMIEFEKDLRNFRAFKDKAASNAAMKDIVKRSCFNTVPVKQYVCALEELGAVPDPRVLQLARGRVEFVATS
eukprot:8993134-Pyramimonas_sp.AAC.1